LIVVRISPPQRSERGLPNLDKFADEILVRLQSLQQVDKLRAGVIQFLDRSLSLLACLLRHESFLIC
jgi:hypothetical protein